MGSFLVQGAGSVVHRQALLERSGAARDAAGLELGRARPRLLRNLLQGPQGMSCRVNSVAFRSLEVEK